MTNAIAQKVKSLQWVLITMFVTLLNPNQLTSGVPTKNRDIIENRIIVEIIGAHRRVSNWDNVTVNRYNGHTKDTNVNVRYLVITL